MRTWLVLLCLLSNVAQAASWSVRVRPEWEVSEVVLEVRYIARTERPWTEMTKPNEAGVVYCIINTWKPARDPSKEMDTLGHELAHCLYGRYHLDGI